MRGKQGGAIAFRLQRRIIPAHAGQTLSVCLAAVAASDHPRACGANHQRTVRGLRQRGSSPRMRGKLRLHPCGELCQRIIPAHAGQTRSSGCRTLRAADHPRACGANIGQEFGEQQQAGSSPRMRGKLGDVALLADPRRIIPAHAGQTAWLA